MRLTVETRRFIWNAQFVLFTDRRGPRTADAVPARAGTPDQPDQRPEAPADRPAATCRPRRVPAVTPEQVRLGETMLAAGHSVCAIATALDVNRPSLYDYLPSLGGTRGQQPPKRP